MAQKEQRDNRLKTFIQSGPVQNFILLVILVNTVIIGLETSKGVMAVAGGLLSVVDSLCLGIFVVELVLKLIALRGSFFRDGWNVFDLIVVAISLMPMLSMLSVLRVLRILRVFRTLRALRLVSGLEKLRVIIKAIFHSIPGIAWTGALLLLVFYIYAVMGTNLFGARFDEWFGTIGRSLYSLFQVMTLESWSMGISRPVMEVFSWAWVYFVTFVIISAFIMLNVVTGVVVSTIGEVTESNRREEALGEGEDGSPPPVLAEEMEKLRAQMDLVQELLEQQRRE